MYSLHTIPFNAHTAFPFVLISLLWWLSHHTSCKSVVSGFRSCINTSVLPSFLPSSSASAYKHRTLYLSLSISWPVYTEACQHMTFLEISSSVRDQWDQQHKITVRTGWEAAKPFLSVVASQCLSRWGTRSLGTDMLSFCMENCSHVILLNREVMIALSNRCGLKKE